jgi:hypothetical protein
MCSNISFLNRKRISSTVNSQGRLYFQYIDMVYFKRRSDSSVGIATGYGLDGLGSNPGGDEVFRTRPDLL